MLTLGKRGCVYMDADKRGSREAFNVTYINGLDLLGDMSLMSADEVHPNIYGVAQIAERITKIVDNTRY